jgi:hypothetical protein
MAVKNKEEKIPKCGEGQYYDAMRQKCVNLPPRYQGRWWGGYYHQRATNGKNGNGNGNGNGSYNGNGNGNGNGGGNGGGNGNGGGGGVSEGIINLPLNIEIPQTSVEFQLGLMFRESLMELLKVLKNYILLLFYQFILMEKFFML